MKSAQRSRWNDTTAYLTQVHLVLTKEISSKKHKQETIILIQKKKSIPLFFKKPSSHLPVCPVYKTKSTSAGNSTKCKWSQQSLYRHNCTKFKFIPLKLIISKKILAMLLLDSGKHRQPMLKLNCQKKTILFQHHLALAFKVILFWSQ